MGYAYGEFYLSSRWVAPLMPNTMANNTLKYVAVDVPMRNRLREAWNQAIFGRLGYWDW